MKPYDPAFGHGNHEQGGDPGLTKREYIAIQAMQGLLASGDAPITAGGLAAKQVAEAAIAHADALIAALQEEADGK